MQGCWLAAHHAAAPGMRHLPVQQPCLYSWLPAAALAHTCMHVRGHRQAHVEGQGERSWECWHAHVHVHSITNSRLGTKTSSEGMQVEAELPSPHLSRSGAAASVTARLTAQTRAEPPIGECNPADAKTCVL